MINDNTIFIKGAAYNSVKKALRQWLDLYSEDLQDDLSFTLSKNGHTGYIIKADERLDNERFYYLVNYLKYPEEIEYTIDIEAFTTGRYENSLKNKKLLVYISPNDKEFDNVFVTTSENKNYKIDFGGKISEANESKIFQLPEIINLDSPELIKLNKYETSRSKEEKSKKQIEKRFKIIGSIAIALFIISLFIIFYDIQIFINVTSYLGLGLGFWFLTDYEMLRSDKLYHNALVISISFLIYGLILREELITFILDFVLWATSYPLAILIIHWPLRKIFITTFKREPIIEFRNGRFSNIIYSIILLFAPMVLSFITMHKLN